jgi:hypothetical protein
MKIWEDLEDDDPDTRFAHELPGGLFTWGPRVRSGPECDPRFTSLLRWLLRDIENGRPLRLVATTDPDFQQDAVRYTYRDCPVPDFVVNSPNPEVREAFKAGVDGASD